MRFETAGAVAGLTFVVASWIAYIGFWLFCLWAIVHFACKYW